MQHATITSSIFYINPQADVLWITEDASDDPRKLLELKRHYGTQLRQISRLAIEDGSWDTRDHLHEFYDLLSGLMYLYITLDEGSLAVDQSTRALSTAVQPHVSTWALDGQLVVQFFCGIPTCQFVTAQGWVTTVCSGADDRAQLHAAFIAAQSWKHSGLRNSL
ncbi:uncharacterized protein PG998_000755 [Apiospora kogelbergensis]|uniref:uncharacterized protein n=1 Tax=Apiospora kogelbergensis TaxID=1337665 RepID=UPI003130AC4C